MIHVSKPTYDMVFLETLFGNINVTIKVSSSFNPTSTLARQTRRTINNPNVYYIYVGFEPQTDDKDYEAVSIAYENAIDNNNSKVVMNQIRCGLFSIIHKNEIAIVDGRTIYIPAPTASKNLFEEIKTYISNPKAYEMGFLMSQIGKIYEKLTTDELNQSRERIAQLNEFIHQHTLALGKFNAELNLLEARYGNDLNVQEDIHRKFMKSMRDLNSYEDVLYAKFTQEGDLIVRTKSIIASGSHYDIVIPPVTVVIGLVSKKYYFTDPESTYTGYHGKDLFHPHAITLTTINGKQHIEGCWGTAKEMLVAAMSKNDIFLTFDILLEFLKQYNASDVAGAYYKNWKKVS